MKKGKCFNGANAKQQKVFSNWRWVFFSIYTTGGLFLHLFILKTLYTEEVTSVCKAQKTVLCLTKEPQYKVNSGNSAVAWNGIATYFVWVAWMDRGHTVILLSQAMAWA